MSCRHDDAHAQPALLNTSAPCSPPSRTFPRGNNRPRVRVGAGTVLCKCNGKLFVHKLNCASFITRITSVPDVCERFMLPLYICEGVSRPRRHKEKARAAQNAGLLLRVIYRQFLLARRRCGRWRRRHSRCRYVARGAGADIRA